MILSNTRHSGTLLLFTVHMMVIMAGCAEISTKVPLMTLTHVTLVTLTQVTLATLTQVTPDLIRVPCGPCACLGLHVDCSGRGLESVPSDAQLPSDAVSMDLSNNNLDDLPDRVFSRFGELLHLDLSKNRLHTLHVSTFEGLRNLQELILSQNYLRLTNKTYPVGVFRPMSTSLRQLRIEGNLRGNDVIPSDEILTYPDEALSELIRLESLTMDGLPLTTFGPGFRNLQSLKELSLSGMDDGVCTMNVLRNDTFVNIPQGLQILNVSDCNISSIEADSFGPLKMLDKLDLSCNVNLGLSALADAVYGLQGSTLRELHINFIVNPYAICVLVRPWHTRYFSNTSIETIYAQHNRLEVFLEGALDNMPDTLQHVDLVGNRLSFGRYFKDFWKLRNLRYVRNDGLKFAPPPPDRYPDKNVEECEIIRDGSGGPCEQDQPPSAVGLARKDHQNADFVAWNPDLKMVGFEAANIPRFAGEDKAIFYLPPKLETIQSRWNKLYYKILEIHFHSNNSLKTLDLSHNLFTVWIGPITGLPHLTSLNLCNNIAHNISTDFFRTLTSLKSFNGSRNNLWQIFKQDKEGKLFEPLENLEVLDMSSNYVDNIHKNFFRGLKSLKKLVLSSNHLGCFDVNISHMKNLQFLDLAYNGIHYLPQHVMDHLDSVASDPNVTVWVNLTYNPLACTCKHIDFLNWIVNSRVYFERGEYYTCLMSDGSTEYHTDIFQMIDEIHKQCVNHVNVLIGTVVCFFVVIFSIVAAVLYQHRWKLRYLYHATKLAFRRIHSTDESLQYEYDAFVCYSSEDNRFVHYELLDKLEKEKGLHLNIHNRNFMPGRYITSNIVDAIQRSRRTLVVLTSDLLTSDWCEYELQMATMEALHTGRDVLLFLLYEHIPSKELSTQMLYTLQSSTYIQYPHNADSSVMEDFWDRLAQAITHS